MTQAQLKPGSRHEAQASIPSRHCHCAAPSTAFLQYTTSVGRGSNTVSWCSDLANSCSERAAVQRRTQFSLKSYPNQPALPVQGISFIQFSENWLKSFPHWFMSMSQPAGTRLLINPALLQEHGKVFLCNTRESKINNTKPGLTDLWTLPAEHSEETVTRISTSQRDTVLFQAVQTNREICQTWPCYCPFPLHKENHSCSHVVRNRELHLPNDVDLCQTLQRR